MRNVLVVLMLVFVSAMFSACGRGYSEGERFGVITKLSKKGVFWKTYEGELLMVVDNNVSSAITPECFLFTILNEEISNKAQIAQQQGNRVGIKYTQWFVTPLSMGTDYEVIDIVQQQK
jgi:hypothetical protein